MVANQPFSVRLQDAEPILEAYRERIEKQCGHKPDKADVVRDAVKSFCSIEETSEVKSEAGCA